MADDILVFVLLQEFPGGRECDLVDISVDFFRSHTYAVVDNAQYLFLLVEFDLHFQVHEFALELAVGGQHLQFLCGVHGVCHELTQEYFVVGIKELFDYRKYVLGGYTDFALQFFFSHNKKTFQLFC